MGILENALGSGFSTPPFFVVDPSVYSLVVLQQMEIILPQENDQFPWQWSHIRSHIQD